MGSMYSTMLYRNSCYSEACCKKLYSSYSVRPTRGQLTDWLSFAILAVNSVMLFKSEVRLLIDHSLSLGLLSHEDLDSFFQMDYDFGIRLCRTAIVNCCLVHYNITML